MANTSSQAPMYKDLIRFVPARREACSASQEKKEDAQLTFKGEEAKLFYENLVSTESNDAHSERVRKRHKWNEGNAGRELENDIILVEDDSFEKQKGSSKHKCAGATSSTCIHKGSDKGKWEKRIGDVSIIREPKQQAYFDVNGEQNEKERTNANVKVVPENDTVSKKFVQTNQNKLLSFAQNGELLELKKMLETDSGTQLNLDCQDKYGWTALMCAAVSRHLDIVKYLLSKGVNKNVVNSQGKTAADLAQDTNAIQIRDTIYLYTRTDHPKVKLHSVKKEKFYCKVCKSNFKESSEKEHSSSTVHLFNLKLKPKTDTFMIPESNVGYQLMKQSGWDGEKGLGPEGQGHKYPIKTALKRDRKCLGSTDKNKTKAKVTHFGAGDVEAVNSFHKHSLRVMSARVASKRERNRREQKNKQWERTMRLYMNTD